MTKSFIYTLRELGTSITIEILATFFIAVVVFLRKKIKEYKKRKQREKELIDIEIDFF